MGKRGESARAACPNDILITLLNGEKTFEKIVEELENKYSRGTVNKYLNELYDAGLITRKGRRGPYILTPDGKKKAETLRRKREILNSIEELPPEKQAEYLEKLEKELKHYKYLAFLHEFENGVYLPLTALLKKLVNMGFELKDFFSEKELLDPDFQKAWPLRAPFPPEGWDKFCFFCFMGDEYDKVLGRYDWEFSPDEIEIKLIPASNTRNYRENQEVQKILDNNYFSPIDENLWVLLSEKPIKGYYILATYRILLEIAKDKVEYKLSKWKELWKEDYGLTDEEWNAIEPEIREMLENGCKPIEINIFLSDYLKNKYAK